MKNGLIGLVIATLASAPLTALTPMVASAPSGTPIRHVIVVVKENHAFDPEFRPVSARRPRCEAKTLLVVMVTV